MRRRPVGRLRLEGAADVARIVLDVSRLKCEVPHQAPTVDADREAFHLAAERKRTDPDTVDSESDRTPDRSAIGALSSVPSLEKTHRVRVG